MSISQEKRRILYKIVMEAFLEITYKAQTIDSSDECANVMTIIMLRAAIAPCEMENELLAIYYAIKENVHFQKILQNKEKS